MIGKIIDTFLDWASEAVVAILLLLPESPVQSWQPQGFDQFAQIMGWINYFVPLGAIAGILSVWLSAVLVWYGARWFLRITKYID